MEGLDLAGIAKRYREKALKASTKKEKLFIMRSLGASGIIENGPDTASFIEIEQHVKSFEIMFEKRKEAILQKVFEVFENKQVKCDENFTLSAVSYLQRLKFIWYTEAVV